MTLDEMKSLLAGRLGQRTDIDNMIYAELRQAQSTLEKTPPYPWFLMARFTGEYALFQNIVPANFIELAEDIVYITKRTIDTAYFAEPAKVYGGYLEHIATAGADRSGRPRNFRLFQNFIEFFPAPDQSYTINLHYYGKQDPLSSPGSTNKWSLQAEDLLVAEAGWHVARNIRDNEAATLFGQDRAEARRRIAQETTSKLESSRRAVIGSGEDALLGQHSWESGHQ